MADPFKNARAFYDVTVPSSGDGFQFISQIKNALQGLGSMDMIPLQPRAHSPADNKIMVRGTDASGFYRPIYGADTNSRVYFSSGDSPTIAAPASLPRIDIVYITPSGDLRVVTGTEAASPTLPTLAPSGDTRLPVCAIYNRPSQTKIFNFEDSAANTGDGYIYQDLRPWLQQPKAASGSSFSASTPVSPTGDGQATPGVSAASARSDHAHGGVHAVRRVGGSNMQGDVEFAGPIEQVGGRLTIANLPMSLFKNLVVVKSGAGTVKITFDDLVLQDTNDRGASARKKSITIDFANGAGVINGLDTGAEAANTIYYIWVLRKSTDGSIGGVFSLNSQAGPTLPSGYDQQALISCVGNDNSSNFIAFHQAGTKYTFDVWATMASGSISAWTAFTLLPTNMSTNAGFVPPNLSTYCFGEVYTAAQGCMITNDSSVSTNINAAAPNRVAAISASQDNSCFWGFDILTANTLYLGTNSVTDACYLGGFEINKLT